LLVGFGPVGQNLSGLFTILDHELVCFDQSLNSSGSSRNRVGFFVIK
jgi:hypothetical protein